MGALAAGYEVTGEITLVRRLGAGGMGTVWLAKHRKLGTEVVVKFLSEALTSDAEATARFEREVQATLQVRSPHVVQTLDHGITESGVPYLVLEWLEGHDLAKELRQKGTLPPSDVQHVVEGLATALTKAHDRGIVHRDIKPANVFLVNAQPRAFVKLVDFGIAKRLEDETMTATNALIGTPAYMSPEQLEGSHQIDHRTDLWALGVLTFHMLAGKPPFKGSHIANIAVAVLQSDRPKISTLRADLPAGIDAWFDRALARDPKQRFVSAQELADTLAETLGDQAFTTNRRGVAALGTGPHLPPRPFANLYDDPTVALDVGPTATGVASSHDIAPTVGSSTLTQIPVSRRLKWGVMALAALGIVLVGVSFKVGYGMRQVPAAPPAETSAPPPLPATPDPVVSVAVPVPQPAQSAPIVMPSASTTVAKPGGRRGRPTPHRNPTPGQPPQPDDVGF